MVGERILDEEYLKKVDKEVKMIPLTFDVVLKGVFERNQLLLRKFVISVLKLNISDEDTKLEISKNELIKENVKEYQKKIDILVILNDNIYVDIEINKSSFEKVKMRNSLYCDKLYTMLLETGDKTLKLKNIYLYQLNLNTEDKSTPYGEDTIVLYSTTTKEIFIDNKIMILKYLEFYRKLYYTNVDKLKEDEIWLASLTAKSFTELNEMLSHILSEEERSNFIGEAIRMSKLNFNLSEWEAEKMNDLMREEAKRIDHEEGFNAGVEQGIEQNTKDTIIAMMENKIDINTISKVTNKTLEEIEKISKEQ